VKLRAHLSSGWRVVGERDGYIYVVLSFAELFASAPEML